MSSASSWWNAASRWTPCGACTTATGCALDAAHGGSFIDAQLNRSLAGQPWPEQLRADVASITAEDFQITAADVDASLDLVAVAVRT